jgi:thioesterase domain-containing protein/acyl carrier protein
MTTSTAVTFSNSQRSSRVEQSNLTELQTIYWTGCKLRPSATLFNNAFLFTFHSAIDPQLFIQAFATAVEQHDALRAIITEENGFPQQEILPEPPADLTFVDLSSEPDPAAALLAWQQQRVQRPLLLDRCLYDSALLKLNDTRFAWFLDQHHLITDASSFFLIANAVMQAYDVLLQGSVPNAAEKPSFAAYAAAQHRFAASSRAAKSHDFWQEKIDHKPDVLHFYGRSPHKISDRVKRWTYNLGASQTAQLQAIAEGADLGAVTPELRQFCLTAALYFSLLQQITGKSRLGFITTIHTRSTQRARQTVGVLMELCPVIVTITPDETILSLMQKVATEMKQLLHHYRSGASQAAAALALDVMFTFVQRPSLVWHNQPVEHQIVHPGSGSERLGLHVHHLAASGRYELYLDFHQDIFSEAEQSHAQQTLQALIQTVLDDPAMPLVEAAIPWPHSEAASLNGQVNSGGNGRSRPAYQAPTNNIEAQLQQIWQEVLAVSPIGIDDDFFGLGGESWQAMNFVSKLEAATGHYLPLATLLTSRTIADLARQLETADLPQAVLEIQAGAPENPPLFLIPGAAGNALAIQRVGQHMAATQPVYTFSMPTFEAEDDLPPAEVDVLAAHYLSEIRAVQPEGPYYLGGYSAGGILAYEVAQQLHAEGETVDYLAIIDMSAPNLNLKYWWRVCHFLASFFRLSTSQLESLFLLGRDGWNRAAYFWRHGLWESMKQYGRFAYRFGLLLLTGKWQQLIPQVKKAFAGRGDGTAGARPILRDMDPNSLTDPRARTLFNIYDRAARKYLPKPYAGRLTLLRCPLGYGRKELRSPYPQYGWQKLVRQIDTHVIEAEGHLALMQEPAAAKVGQLLQTSLSQAIK